MIWRECAEWGDWLGVTLRGGVREGPRGGGTGSVSQLREGQVKAKRTECKALWWGEPGLLTHQLSRWGAPWEEMEVVSGSQFTWDLRIHFMLRASEVKDHSFVFIHVCAALCLVAQFFACPVFCDSTDCSPPGSSVHGDSPGKNTGVACHFLLHGTFPIQGLKPGLPHGRQNLYCLSHQGSPRILEWVAYSFSRGISWSRNRTGVSCIAGGFFTF